VATATSEKVSRKELEEEALNEKSGVARRDRRGMAGPFRHRRRRRPSTNGWRAQVNEALNSIALDAPVPPEKRRQLHRLANAVADWLREKRR
jgi:hypothetical protein